jgi:hypothetical protein
METLVVKNKHKNMINTWSLLASVSVVGLYNEDMLVSYKRPSSISIPPTLLLKIYVKGNTS